VLPALVLALALNAADGDDKTPGRVRDGILIGLSGLTSVAAYTTGAFLTGDRPGGHVLAIIGGGVSLGLTAASLAMLGLSGRKDPWSLITYALVTVASGLVGGAVGAVTAYFTALNPGPGRTATHGVIIGLIITETTLAELSRLVR
jgi:hypothetical protein